MNIEITSASRKEQRADAVPGAVYVISQDDIRRSGMTTVPELLRLVPGLQVAQIDAAFFRVGALQQLGVEAYSRVDARFEAKLTPQCRDAAS